MARMRILTPKEQAAFDRPPMFGHRGRKRFLDLPKGLMDTAATMRAPSGRIGFLLMCGYFRAVKRFHQPQDFHERGIEAAARPAGLKGQDFPPGAYARQTRARHRRPILDFHGSAPFDRAAKAAPAVGIAAMARMHLKPRLMFGRRVDFLMRRRARIPTAHSLADRIRAGLHERRAELAALMDGCLSDGTRSLLDGLFTAPGDRNRLTLLRKLPQSTRPARIREGVAGLGTLAALHDRLGDTLPALGPGVAGVQYHAGSVLRSEVFQTHRREASDRYVHAAAFIAHQVFRIQDSLVGLWLSVMASFQTAADRGRRERLPETRKDRQDRIRSVVDGLDTGAFGLIREIRSLTEDDGLPDSLKAARIRALPERGRTVAFERLKADMSETGQDRSWSEVLESHSLKLQGRPGPILRAPAFEPNGRVAPLTAAVDRFRATDGNVGEHAPTDFPGAGERAAPLRDGGPFRPSLYKVFLFQHVTGRIRSGDLNPARSYRYRPMDACPIDRDRWSRGRERLLERAGLSGLAGPAPVLAELDEAPVAQYRATNDRAVDSPHLGIRADGTFHAATPAPGASEAGPLGELFPRRHVVPPAQVMETVNSHCGMLRAFGHWQRTHVRQATSRPALPAGIMGPGCGIGVRRMARIPSRVSESELERAVNRRFPLDSVRAANDAVAGAMDRMELPNLHRRGMETLHTASDGQRFEARGEGLRASRSFRCFGQGQGVSACTFVDGRHFLWHSLMTSAADRESACVIDGPMRNDVVRSGIHSTDTHGCTEAVSGLAHLPGFSFAPRIKGVGRQAPCILRPKGRAEERWCIKPHRAGNDALVRGNRDGPLRPVATIRLRENTASDIFRRLSSHSRQHALHQTLRSFGQIVRSLSILRYVDDPDLRRAIGRQLNKVEPANRFTRAVAAGNPRGFTQAEKEEQGIAEACSRLIRNSIVCWNHLHLARQVGKAGHEEAREGLRRTIAAHPPMSWAHINMPGEYGLSDGKLKDSVGTLPLKPVA